LGKRLISFIRDFFLAIVGRKPDSTDADDPAELCCQGRVHIAYRGLADDRLYMAYDRTWQEVRFFKPNGLRVFCADCRRHLF